MYEKIKKFYDLGLWTKKMVEDAFNKGVINEKEYLEIVD